MDYDLSRLNSRSFEQLVQALSTKVIAPGMVSFGDGPDGGRDAGYVGAVPYPSQAEPWDGVIVVQAKFRQRTQGTKVDTAWALEQLQSELETSFDPESTRVKPTHYIFATNVALSSVPKVGGKDQLSTLARSRFPLDGFQIWDHDQICTYLDAHEDVRRAFLGYICPGDVLADVAKHVGEEAPDFDEIIINFVAKELLSDQYAKLEQAGRVADEEIPIARVFVDLPVLPTPAHPASPIELTEEILSIAGERLGPHSRPPTEAFAEYTEHSDGHRGRLVLVGGPGQGKTTAGQFVCQLFRTSLLQSRDPASIAPEARSVMDSMAAQCEEDDIPLPSVRRFPIRIPLTELSDCLAAEGRPNSLLGFMVERIEQRVDRKLPSNAFRKWLAEYPWLLVLDGLDEVPASSNRAAVLEAIQGFWIDVTQQETDVLVLATTRPQGYNDDFSPEIYRHLTLAPLSPERALHYGRRLAQARHGSDELRRDKIVERLERAVHNPATAKLMTSPLQVTIMATLVNRGGQPPQERWKLFSEYYSVIYQREVEREIPAADVLRDHQPDIDAIHHRLAMLLQVEAEHTRHAEARMSTQRFAEIVRQRLFEEGHEGAVLDELEKRIISAAADRLVFIVGLEADRVGFEIRSLQEFMAAEALMDGGEKCVTDRLRAIAGVTSWRNVFLFAAGRCFADRQYLRDTIYTICGELNDSTDDPLAPIALPGSLLATDLLGDGFTRNQPTYSRLLANEALKLLDNHEEEIRLNEAYHPSLEKPYREALEKGLRGSPRTRERCIDLLFRMSNREIGWAERLLDAHIPSDGSGLNEVLKAIPPKTPWVEDRIGKHLGELSIAQFLRHINTLSNLERNPAFNAVNRLRVQGHRERSTVSLNSQLSSTIFELWVNAVGPADRRWLSAELADHAHGNSLNPWPGLVAALRFAAQPDTTELATQLRKIAEEVPPQDWSALRTIVPWPLAIALFDAEESRWRLEELASQAEQGGLGDLDSWQAAEARWTRHGLSLADFDHVTMNGASIDHTIDVRGFPFDVAHWRLPPGSASSAIEVLLDSLEHVTNPPGRRMLVGWLVPAAARSAGRKGDLPSAQRFARAVDGMHDLVLEGEPADLVPALDWSAGFSREEARLLDLVGKTIGPLSPGSTPDIYSPFNDRTLKQMTEFWETEQSSGLYRVLAAGLSMRSPTCEQVLRDASTKVARDNPGATGILILKTGRVDRVPEAMDMLAAATAANEPAWLSIAIDTIELEKHAEDVLRRTWDITNANGICDQHPDITEELLDLAEELVDGRATDLRSPTTWESLELSEPLPQADATAPEPSSIGSPFGL